MKKNLTIIGISDFGEEVVSKIVEYYNHLKKTYPNHDSFNDSYFSYNLVKDTEDIGRLDNISAEIVILIVDNDKDSVELLQNLENKIKSGLVICILNKQINVNFINSYIFFKTDNEAYQIAKLFIDLLCVPTFIGIDFDDVKAIFSSATFAFKTKEISKKYSNTGIPLFEDDSFLNADAYVVVIYGNKNLEMTSVNEVLNGISPFVKDNAKIIFSAYMTEQRQEDKIKVDVLFGKYSLS